MFSSFFLLRPQLPIEPLIGGLRPGTAKYVASVISNTTIEPLIGGLILFSVPQGPLFLSIEPLIGGLKCSFSFLERGAVEELFTGLECGE